MSDTTQPAWDGRYDCPAGMVEAAEDTLWFTDKEGIAAFDEENSVQDAE